MSRGLGDVYKRQYTYKSMYEEAGNDLTGANFAHVDGNGENH